MLVRRGTAQFFSSGTWVPLISLTWNPPSNL
jgi:hypothetical protein